VRRALSLCAPNKIHTVRLIVDSHWIPTPLRGGCRNEDSHLTGVEGVEGMKGVGLRGVEGVGLRGGGACAGSHAVACWLYTSPL
jgi:hypothetical protein